MDPQQAEKFARHGAPVSPSAPTVTDPTPTGPPVSANVVALDGHPLIVLQEATAEQRGAYLMPLPSPEFWQRVRRLHVLRLVGGAPEIEDFEPHAKPLVYVVRPGHEDEDKAALDAALAKQGGPIPHAFPHKDRPGMFTDWEFLDTGYRVQVVAGAAIDTTPETATENPLMSHTPTTIETPETATKTP
jgi:hypothetical protein